MKCLRIIISNYIEFDVNLAIYVCQFDVNPALISQDAYSNGEDLKRG